MKDRGKTNAMKTVLAPFATHNSNHHGTLIGFPDADAPITLAINFKPKLLEPEILEELNNLISDFPSEREYLSPADLKELKGIEAEFREELSTYFSEAGLTPDFNSQAGHSLILSATVEQIEEALHTTIGTFISSTGHHYIDTLSHLWLPETFVSSITNISGLGVSSKNEYRIPTKPQKGSNEEWDKGYSLKEIREAYKFPQQTGKGQSIGIIELGGHFKKSDIDQYCKHHGIKKPKISIVGKATHSQDAMADGEVTMDIQIIKALAPDAKIVIYYADTILEAMKLVVNDTEHCPSVVSISWAAPEHYYHNSQIQELDQIFYEASLLGITIVASSGDNGAFNLGYSPSVNIPASHPYVIGCGGTTALIEEGEIKKEIVWNELNGNQSSGGGFSQYYHLPEFQIQINDFYTHSSNTKRGVPDVSALASVVDGYQIIFKGQKMVIGGTSASAPLWAALIAVLNECLGYRLGFCNTLLYSCSGRSVFNEITDGHNQLYKSGKIWNAATGLGSPNGEKLLEMIHKIENEEKENN